MPHLLGGSKRDRLDPKLMYLAMQMGLQLGKEYQKRCDKVVITTINGSVKDHKGRRVMLTDGRALPELPHFAKVYYRFQKRLSLARPTRQNSLSMSA